MNIPDESLEATRYVLGGNVLLGNVAKTRPTRDAVFVAVAILTAAGHTVIKRTTYGELLENLILQAVAPGDSRFPGRPGRPSVPAWYDKSPCMLVNTSYRYGLHKSGDAGIFIVRQPRLQALLDQHPEYYPVARGWCDSAVKMIEDRLEAKRIQQQAMQKIRAAMRRQDQVFWPLNYWGNNIGLEGLFELRDSLDALLNRYAPGSH